MDSSDAESRGPTIHSVVMDERTTDLFQMLDRDVRGRLDAFALPFIATLEEAVRQAYIRGVRDGFQQGALAADLFPSNHALRLAGREGLPSEGQA